MFKKRRMFDARKGLSIGLTLVLLLLALAPVGQARGTAAAPTLDSASPDVGLAAAWRLPYVRFGQSAVLDYGVTTARMILFGGSNGRQFFNDVWALDVTTPGSESWTKLNPAGPWPPPRAWHTAVYDHDGRRMIVYGGHSFHYDFDDAWILDLTPGAETWSQLQPGGTAIGPRRFHSAVYDSARDQMVVFGGSRGGRMLNDTWALDLATPGSESWSQWAVGGSVPAARAQHTAIYEEDSDIMVVFGGLSAAGVQNDTWILNLGTRQWAQAPLAGPPPARRGHTVGYREVSDRMYVFGGLGSNGFFNDLWELDLTPGEVGWRELFPTGTPPAGRAWHAAAYYSGLNHMYVWGGRGMDGLEGETQWRLNVGGLNWAAIEPSLPGWLGGAAEDTKQAGVMPDVSLRVEDAQPDTTVSVMPDSEVWFVAQVKTTSGAYATDVDLTLDVASPRFEVVEVGLRYKDALDVESWHTATYLGSGRYRLENVDLEKRGSDTQYQMQVIFKANVKADAPAGRTTVSLVAEGTNWTYPLEYSAYAVIRSAPRAWIVTNRTKLFDEYGASNVRTLLDTIYDIAQGGAGNGPPAVVLYADRYVPSLETWDNTAVNYASEATANVVANDLDAWLDSWPTTPTYLALVGDDNILPRYRKADYDLWCSDGAGGIEDCSEDGHPDCWGMESVCDDMVLNDYFWTDNPYGDVAGGTDWQVGDLEIAVGRIVAATAQDLNKLLRYANRGPRAGEDRAIIASGYLGPGDVDVMDWDVSGSAEDARYAIGTSLGYDYDLPFVDGGPTKPDIVAAMNAGYAVAALAHHGAVTAWQTPGDGDDLWCYEVPDYDQSNLMPTNRPFFYFDACRVGLSYGSGWDDPTRPDGPQAYDDSLVYGLVHQGISGVVASGGLSYYCSGDDDLCYGEVLSNDFWKVAEAYPDRSDPLGWALMRAKERFAVTSDTGRKTVQEFTYFGLPWMRLPGHATAAEAAALPAGEVTDTAWSTPAGGAPQGSYTTVATIDASNYALGTTPEGYDLIEVQGLDQRLADGQPVLPRASLEVILPLSATVTSLTFTPSQDVALANLDIPSILPTVGLADAPTGSYTGTLEGVYPVTATYASSLLDTYQLVRVDVVPVTYDATLDQATLYRNVEVELAYDTPQVLALTYFETDEPQYLPSETINTNSRLSNAGDVAQTVTATLVIQDVHGQVAGWEASAPFEVPAGGSYDLALGWTGPLAEDNYVAGLLIWQGGEVLAGAGQGTLVAAGQISELEVAEEWPLGQAGTLRLTYDNLIASPVFAMGSVGIYDEEGGLVDFLEPQAVAVAAGASGTLTFAWTPPAIGTYSASAVIVAGGQEYGPLSGSFEVRYQRLYLPLVVRK
ncbi:MAG: kelch repeat-containing protein [Anaerolineae bacterium]